MKNFSRACLALLAATAALPTVALAQEESTDGITISANATVVSDYRFRGVSQTGEKGAIQGGFSISHDSGFYVGTWGSNVNFGGAGAEIDAFAGYAREITSGLTADIGVTAYFYPGLAGDTTIIEPYFSLSGDVGPASLKAAVAWVPGGQNSMIDPVTLEDGRSAIYLSGDAGIAIPSTPFTLKGHLGYAKSDSVLGGPDGDAVDYSIGLETSYKQLTLGVSYVNTDWSPRAAKEYYGADGAVIFSLGASF